jgi:hypothetical protein
MESLQFQATQANYRVLGCVKLWNRQTRAIGAAQMAVDSVRRQHYCLLHYENFIFWLRPS